MIKLASISPGLAACNPDPKSPNRV